jgi:hypothetical protein
MAALLVIIQQILNTRIQIIRQEALPHDPTFLGIRLQHKHKVARRQVNPLTLIQTGDEPNPYLCGPALTMEIKP